MPLIVSSMKIPGDDSAPDASPFQPERWVVGGGSRNPGKGDETIGNPPFLGVKLLVLGSVCKEIVG